eukprot:jgi/Mesvir1/18748/Mv01255-RA.1
MYEDTIAEEGHGEPPLPDAEAGDGQPDVLDEIAPEPRRYRRLPHFMGGGLIEIPSTPEYKKKIRAEFDDLKKRRSVSHHRVPSGRRVPRGQPGGSNKGRNQRDGRLRSIGEGLGDDDDGYSPSAEELGALGDLQLQSAAATYIEARVRGYLVRHHRLEGLAVRAALARRRAAITIQRKVRGCLRLGPLWRDKCQVLRIEREILRQERAAEEARVRQLKAEEDERLRRHSAAVTIQRHARGWAARKNYERLHAEAAICYCNRVPYGDLLACMDCYERFHVHCVLRMSPAELVQSHWPNNRGPAVVAAGVGGCESPVLGGHYSRGKGGDGRLVSQDDGSGGSMGRPVPAARKREARRSSEADAVRVASMMRLMEVAEEGEEEEEGWAVGGPPSGGGAGGGVCREGEVAGISSSVQNGPSWDGVGSPSPDSPVTVGASSTDQASSSGPPSIRTRPTKEDDLTGTPPSLRAPLRSDSPGLPSSPSSPTLPTSPLSPMGSSWYLTQARAHGWRCRHCEALHSGVKLRVRVSSCVDVPFGSAFTSGSSPTGISDTHHSGSHGRRHSLPVGSSGGIKSSVQGGGDGMLEQRKRPVQSTCLMRSSGSLPVTVKASTAAAASINASLAAATAATATGGAGGNQLLEARLGTDAGSGSGGGGSGAINRGDRFAPLSGPAAPPEVLVWCSGIATPPATPPVASGSSGSGPLGLDGGILPAGASASSSLLSPSYLARSSSSSTPRGATTSRLAGGGEYGPVAAASNSGDGAALPPGNGPDFDLQQRLQMPGQDAARLGPGDGLAMASGGGITGPGSDSDRQNKFANPLRAGAGDKEGASALDLSEDSDCVVIAGDLDPLMASPPVSPGASRGVSARTTPVSVGGGVSSTAGGNSSSPVAVGATSMTPFNMGGLAGPSGAFPSPSPTLVGVSLARADSLIARQGRVSLDPLLTPVPTFPPSPTGNSASASMSPFGHGPPPLSLEMPTPPSAIPPALSLPGSKVGPGGSPPGSNGGPGGPGELPRRPSALRPLRMPDPVPAGAVVTAAAAAGIGVTREVGSVPPLVASPSPRLGLSSYSKASSWARRSDPNILLDPRAGASLPSQGGGASGALGGGTGGVGGSGGSGFGDARVTSDTGDYSSSAMLASGVTADGSGYTDEQLQKMAAMTPRSAAAYACSLPGGKRLVAIAPGWRGGAFPALGRAIPGCNGGGGGSNELSVAVPYRIAACEGGAESARCRHVPGVAACHMCGAQLIYSLCFFIIGRPSLDSWKTLWCFGRLWWGGRGANGIIWPQRCFQARLC